jgi:hypothetical protein
MPLYYGVLPRSQGGTGTGLTPAASVSFQPSNPTGTAVLNTLLMMGLGSSVVYTPAATGIVAVTIGGWTNIATATNIITAGARYGILAGPATTVAAGSNGGEISAIASWGPSFGGNGNLDVASTAGWASSGTLWVPASGSTMAQVSYTGTAGGNQFTGCTYVTGSATGTVATGGAVTGYPQNAAQVVGTRFGSNADLPHSPPAAGTKDQYIAFPDRLALTAGTQYWFDITLSTNNASDTVTIVSVSATLTELLG